MDFFEQVQALRREGKPFAVATVVARRAPVSSHLGDHAIVFADGRMEGFIGGACSREIIRKQALEAIRARCGRWVSIRPDESGPAESGTEHVVVRMTCVSEGAIDVYVEPYVPPRRLVVVGATPVAEALARLGRAMNYDVARLVDRSEMQDIELQTKETGIQVVALDDIEAFLRESSVTSANLAAVVASQGHYDETALESILKSGASYVGLVASRKRGAAIQALLKAGGAADVEKIRIPAGVDLGARTPPEVALSILAEIVQTYPSGVAEKTPAAMEPGLAASQREAIATDPVCGMPVEMASARYTAKVDATVYYFCCAGCRAQFLQNPSQFRTATA